MTHEVFISYARTESAAHARALAAKLGKLAFFDTDAIDDGDQFPSHLLNGIVDASVVVIFATKAYSERRFCRLEMRLALNGGDATTSHVVLALGKGSASVLDAMPESVACQNWPPVEATLRLEELVRQRLATHPAPLRRSFSEAEAQKLAAVFLEESNVPEPQTLHGIVCSMPHGVASQSIGSRFVGRAGDLRRIHQTLAEGGGTSARMTSRIAAGGGVGKTRLATEYLHRYGPRYYPGGLFWVNAASSSVEWELWRVLSALDAALPDLPAMRVQGRNIRLELERALRKIGRPALYVIDNIPEAGPGEDAPSIGDFCPALGAVTVLATSRQDPREEGVKTIPVDTLGRDAAILLLTESIPSVGRLPWADWGRIAEWVGDLPIALDLLNRCIALNSVTAEELHRRVHSLSGSPSSTAEMDRLHAALQGQVPRGAVRGITEAFQVSFEKLDAPTQSAAMLLAQLAPVPIPEAFLDGLPQDWKSPSVRAALRSRHFVTSGSDLFFGIMHRLMADFLRSRAGKRSADLLEVACSCILQVMTADRCRDPHQWREMNLFRPHAKTLFERAAASKSTQVALTRVGAAAAILASAQGDHADARRLDEQVLELRMRVQGEEHLETLATMNNLASTLDAQGYYARARALQEQVLEVRMRVQGEEHPDYLTAMNNLASTLRAQGDHSGARQLDERVLDVRMRVQGEEHPDTLTAMSNLALTLSAQGDHAGAQRLQRRVLDMRTRVLSKEHPNTLTAMNNLASTLSARGQYSVARGLQERVLEISTRVLGEEHPDTLRAMSNLASTLRDQGDHAAARRLEQRVLEVRMRVLGEEHPDTLTLMNNLALTLSAQGDHVEARRLQERGLEVRMRVLGEEHPDTLRSMTNLALTLRAQGDYAGARQLQERTREVSTRVLGEEHPDTLASTGSLALTLTLCGDHVSAQRLQEQSLNVSRRVLGEEHPDTLASMDSLGLTLRRRGELAEARRLQERVLDVRRRVLGKDHPATLTSMNNLALTLREQGELGEARPLQERVLDVRIGALGEQHPATLTSMWNLGLTLLDLGEKDTALQLLRRCLAGRRKVLGDQHRSTTATAELLKSVTEEAKLEKSRNQKV